MRWVFFRILLYSLSIIALKMTLNVCCLKLQSTLISYNLEGSGTFGKFWFRVIRDMAVQDLNPGLQSSEILTGFGGSSSKVVHSDECWMLTGGFSSLPSRPLFMELLECPQNVAACFPQRRWSKALSQSSSDFYDLTSWWKSHSIIYAICQVSPTKHVRELYKGVSTRRWESWGAVLEAGCHTLSGN